MFSLEIPVIMKIDKMKVNFQRIYQPLKIDVQKDYLQLNVIFDISMTDLFPLKSVLH